MEKGACTCCGHPSELLTPVSRYGVEHSQLMCPVCYRTNIGNVALYPENKRDVAELAIMLAQCTNLILDALKVRP